MPDLCKGRVVIVTGAGAGIGREEALEFGRQGAKVVVNDLGVDLHGNDTNLAAADRVVEEIRAEGGEAIANGEDVSDWDGARRLVHSAVDTYGQLDVLVNNAGILRDRMLVNMTMEEWDSVIRVHLRGTFAPTRHAAEYWRTESKNGTPRDARIINTSSGSGLYGNVGQSNYGAAKAGIAAMTIIISDELARYGVTVNAIAPAALTRMTEDRKIGERARLIDQTGGFNEWAPDNIAPLVVWLGSDQSSDVTGRVFNVRGGLVGVAESWSLGPEEDKGARWKPEELSDVVPRLLAAARPNTRFHSTDARPS